MQKLISLVRAHKIIVAVVVLALALVGWQISTRKEVAQFDTATVIKGDIVQEVSVTGKIASEEEIDLTFERSGKVATRPAQVGDVVAKGAALVRLDASELSALRTQAQANLDYERARLEELKRGARAEDIAVTASQVQSAEDALSDATSALLDKLALANDALQDAVYAKTDTLFENPRTSSLKFTVPIPDQKLISSIESERVAVGEALEKISPTDPEAYFSTVKEALTTTKKYLDDLLFGVSNVQPSSSYGQTSIDTAKANVIAARTGISTAQTLIIAAEEKYSAARRALAVAEDQLTLKQAPATPESIAAQDARVRAAEATVANYDAQIAKMTLVAPFSGVVTKQNAKLGQSIAPNVPMVTLQSAGLFKIETNIPEVDVAKIKVGNTARVTLDAYGPDVIFKAHVTAIDPAETIIENVPTYKVTLYFDEKDERVRTGMTANIDILADKREGVLHVPSRAVTLTEGVKTVQVLEAGKEKTVVVQTGLRGSDGQIEILSGLTEGQQIVTFTKAQ